MDILQTILLHTMWMVHLFFQRLLSNPSTNSLPKTSSLKMMKPKRMTRLKKDIIDFDVYKSPNGGGLQREQPVHLLFNEKKSSLIDLSDIVTPVEEEMLRCLCAKGFEKNPAGIRLSYAINPRKAYSEICIPRDIFTSVWINSCSPT